MTGILGNVQPAHQKARYVLEREKWLLGSGIRGQGSGIESVFFQTMF